ncbi:hypothetical protein ACNKHL_05695 [Shigella flexneri]
MPAKGNRRFTSSSLACRRKSDGFPAAARESIMEETLLPPVEDFPDAEENGG